MKSFSIVICTYNPDFTIFKRLLDAILNFKITSPLHEVIIVDNNSQPALRSNLLLEDFLLKKPNARLIQEKTPGLTAARIAGIKEAKYDWIVFFDDDNVPNEKYLIEAAELGTKYPQVRVWGPGCLSVCYLKSAETAFLKKIKWLFQERDYKGVFFDNNIIEGSIYYPFGTGMIIQKDALIEYTKRVNIGRYTMSDRKGKNLTSAGDVQLLFTCLQMGYYAGSSNTLKLIHLIDATKATKKYAIKLVYALNSSQLKAYQEVFPDKKLKIQEVTNYDVLKVVYAAIRSYRLHSKDYTLMMYLSKRLGELKARVVAFDIKRPIFLKLFEIIFIND